MCSVNEKCILFPDYMGHFLCLEVQASETNHLGNPAVKMNHELPCWFLIVLKNVFQRWCDTINEFVYVSIYKKSQF